MRKLRGELEVRGDSIVCPRGATGPGLRVPTAVVSISAVHHGPPRGKSEWTDSPIPGTGTEVVTKQQRTDLSGDRNGCRAVTRVRRGHRDGIGVISVRESTHVWRNTDVRRSETR